MAEPRKIRRYFTKQDYLDGLCDKNGRAIPKGPKEPPKRPIPDSQPTKAQQDLAPEPETVTGGQNPPDDQIPGAAAARNDE